MRKLGYALVVVVGLLALLQFQPSVAYKPAYWAFKYQKAAVLEEERKIHSELIGWRMVGKQRGYFYKDYTGYDEMVKADPAFAEFDRRRKDVERRKKELMERYPDERGW